MEEFTCNSTFASKELFITLYKIIINYLLNFLIKSKKYLLKLTYPFWQLLITDLHHFLKTLKHSTLVVKVDCSIFHPKFNNYNYNYPLKNKKKLYIIKVMITHQIIPSHFKYTIPFLRSNIFIILINFFCKMWNYW